MSADYNFRFKSALQGIGCSASSYAVLNAPLVTRKLSQQMVSQITNGTREFENDAEAAEHFRVLAAMNYLQETVVPQVPINWSDPLRIRDILASTFAARENELDPIVVQSPFLRLSKLNFFQKVDSHGVVPTINPERHAAAFKDLALAQQAVAELKNMGIAAQIERLTAPRRSTIVTSLEEVGFKSQTAGWGHTK